MARTPEMSRGPIIRASEIGQYAYCAHAWWLDRVQGLVSANVDELALGRRLHTDHGQLVAGTLQLRRLAVILAGLATLCLMLAVLLGRGR
jgi:hypothetical protein